MYLTLSTLQQSVGSAKVFRHTVEQLLMRIFYAPSTVKLWRKSSRTFQRYLSDDRVFKIIANTNRCDWSRLFHSDFRRIACFSPPRRMESFQGWNTTQLNQSERTCIQVGTSSSSSMPIVLYGSKPCSRQ